MSGTQPGSSAAGPRRSAPILAALLMGLLLVGSALAIQLMPRDHPSSSPSANDTTDANATEPPVFGLDADAYSCGGVAFAPGVGPDESPTEDVSGSSASASTAVGGPVGALDEVTARLPDLLPDTGWNPIGGSGTNVTYVALNDRTPAPYSFVDVTLSGRTWTATSYGDCEPALPPAGQASALDPIKWDVVPPVPTSGLEIEAEFQANLCNETFVGSTIWYGPTNVTVTFWARVVSATGTGASCTPDSAMAPYTLSLPEPLGAKQLRTGPTSDAKPATTAVAS